MKGAPVRGLVFVAAALLVFCPAQMTMGPVAADESGINADVTVVTNGCSYGGSILSSSRVLFASRAVGEPDGRGAWLLRKGEIVIELEQPVSDISSVSVWAARLGHGAAARLYVYASPDGEHWTYLGHLKLKSAGYTEHRLAGDLGEAAYLKLRSGSSRWSIVLVDAVLGET